MLAYYWPGNIRELENMMRRYVILRRPEMIVEELADMAARRKTLAARRARRESSEDGIRPAPRDGIVDEGSEDVRSPARTRIAGTVPPRYPYLAESTRPEGRLS